MAIPHVSSGYRKSPAVAGVTEAVAVHHRFPRAVQDKRLVAAPGAAEVKIDKKPRRSGVLVALDRLLTG